MINNRRKHIKQKQFELVKSLDKKMSYRKIAEKVSEVFGFPQYLTYSPATMSAWAKYDSYEKYSKDMVIRNKASQQKKLAKNNLYERFGK